MKRTIILFCISVIAIFSCQKMQPKAPADDQILDGPVEGLTAEEKLQFLRGDRAFNDEIFTAKTGLGPLFVSTSCGSCHAGDGKGHPFTTLTRFGQTDSTGNKFLHVGAPQLQNRAIINFLPEQIPPGATFTKLTPPANTGMGFIDAISDADILAMADPDDADGDGISGVPNWIHFKDYLSERNGIITNGGRCIGRFGKKSGAYDLMQQTAGAYNQDMGITSSYEPYDTYSGQEVDPEISNQTLLDVVFYLKTLKAPVQRDANDVTVIKGKDVFVNIDCGKCHVPELRTGASPITALAFKKFAPYTDLLLHDMGPILDDGYTEGNAKTSEWRTPALWGLGLSKNSQGGQYFLLHDGRARTIQQAIEMHGGEAKNSVGKYFSLSGQDKQALIKFLESL